MSATVLDGKKIARRIRESLKRDIKIIKAKKKRTLKLAAVYIGKSASSAIYLNAQKKLANELGIEYQIRTLSKNISPLG